VENNKATWGAAIIAGLSVIGNVVQEWIRSGQEVAQEIQRIAQENSCSEIVERTVQSGQDSCAVIVEQVIKIIQGT